MRVRNAALPFGEGFNASPPVDYAFVTSVHFQFTHNTCCVAEGLELLDVLGEKKWPTSAFVA